MKLLGLQLGWSESKVSRVENAKQGFEVEDVSAILAVLRVTGDDRERILKMAREIDQPAWWELSRGLPAQLSGLIDAEQRAHRIIDVTLNLVPGLLQTRAYSRACFVGGEMAPEKIDEAVAIRQARQGILERDEPTELNVFMDETALLRPVGSHAVTAEQLRYVISASQRPNINVRLLPLNFGAHIGLDGTFVLLEFLRGKANVHMEARNAGVILSEPQDVGPFEQAVARLGDVAIDADESAKLIADHAARHESEAG